MSKKDDMELLQRKIDEIIDKILAGEIRPTEEERKAQMKYIRDELVKNYPVFPERSKKLLYDAASRALEIEKRSERDRALQAIAVEMGRLDPDEGVRLVEEMESPVCRIYSLAGIARAISATEREKARKLLKDAATVARGMESDYYKAEALVQLGGVVAEYDGKEARKLLKQSLKIARKLNWRDGQRKLIGSIAAALPKVDERRGKVVLNEAISKILCIRDDGHRAASMSRLAHKMAGSDPGKSEALFNLALSIARVIDDNSERVWSLVETAKYISWSDDLQGADMFREAIEVAKSIKDENRREAELRYIRKELKQAGTGRAVLLYLGIKTDEDLQEAIKFCRTTEDRNAGIELLYKISAALLDHDRERGDELLNECIDMARGMKNGVDKAINLSSIARLQTENNREVAEQLFAEAISVAEEIKERDEKAHAERVIAYKLAALDIERGLALAEKIEVGKEKVEALLNIAMDVAMTDIERGIEIFEKSAEIELNTAEERPTPKNPISQEEIERRIVESMGIEDGIDKVVELLNLSLDASASGKNEVLRILMKAMNAAQSIRDNNARTDVESIIVKELLRVDTSMALSNARWIEDDRKKANMLTRVAWHISSEDYEEAIMIFKEGVFAGRGMDTECLKEEPTVQVLKIDAKMAGEIAAKETRKTIDSLSDEEIMNILKSADAGKIREGAKAIR